MEEEKRMKKHEKDAKKRLSAIIKLKDETE